REAAKYTQIDGISSRLVEVGDDVAVPAADPRIPAAANHECIRPAAAGHAVVTGSAGDHILAAAARERIVACSAVELIDTGIAINHIVAVASIDCVVPAAAINRVVAGARHDVVAAHAAPHRVVAIPRIYGAATCRDGNIVIEADVIVAVARADGGCSVSGGNGAAPGADVDRRVAVASVYRGSVLVHGDASAVITDSC